MKQIVTVAICILNVMTGDGLYSGGAERSGDKGNLLWLIESSGLGLRLWSSRADEALMLRLTMPITWVHSSDLDDPTPFLSPGNVLLTDGAQFGFADAAEDFDYLPYLDRLMQVGIVGLGLATEFLHRGMPRALAAACEAVGFPLLEVPDRVPFIAIIRRVADHLSAEQMRQLDWSVSAQKAISRAALKPNGLQSILAELERQLDCWVAMYDSLGNRLQVATARAIPSEIDQAVAHAARELLRGTSRSGSSFTIGENQITMQTLGQGNALRGVLSLGRGAPLDRAENELLTSVIAIAGLALEQNRALDAARRHLRSGLLELLLDGNTAVVENTAQQLWGALPREPVLVYTISALERSQLLFESMELLSEDQAGRVFFALRSTNAHVLCEPKAAPAVERVLAEFGRPIGVSLQGPYRALGELLSQAEMALRSRGSQPGIARFSEIHETGMLGLLRGERAGHVALQVLSPILDHDRDSGTNLLGSLRAWLSNDCHWDQAASELGVHRHTMRNRITQASEIIGIDLDGLAGRLELWAAMQLVDESAN